MAGQIVPPQPLDVAAWITIRLHANGGLAVSGHLGDKRLALAMLDHARDALKNQLSDTPIIMPNRDVDLSPAIPLRDVGSMPENERGDP